MPTKTEKEHDQLARSINGGYYVVENVKARREFWEHGPDYRVYCYTADGKLIRGTWHIGETEMLEQCEKYRKLGAIKRTGN